MKDAFGYELEIGDQVAFNEPGYTYELKIGTIIKTTKQKVVIQWNDSVLITYKFPKQVAKNTKYHPV